MEWKNARASEKIHKISTKDAYLLCSSGSRILHDKVFRHKNPELNIRIISKGADLSETGNVVNSDITDLDIAARVIE